MPGFWPISVVAVLCSVSSYLVQICNQMHAYRSVHSGHSLWLPRPWLKIMMHADAQHEARQYRSERWAETRDTASVGGCSISRNSLRVSFAFDCPLHIVLHFTSTSTLAWLFTAALSCTSLSLFAYNPCKTVSAWSVQISSFIDLLILAFIHSFIQWQASP